VLQVSRALYLGIQISYANYFTGCLDCSVADQAKAFWFLGNKNFCLPKLAEEIVKN
jgi:hypothetical protein